MQWYPRRNEILKNLRQSIESWFNNMNLFWFLYLDIISPSYSTIYSLPLKHNVHRFEIGLYAG